MRHTLPDQNPPLKKFFTKPGEFPRERDDIYNVGTPKRQRLVLCNALLLPGGVLMWVTWKHMGTSPAKAYSALY